MLQRDWFKDTYKGKVMLSSPSCTKCGVRSRSPQGREKDHDMHIIAYNNAEAIKKEHVSNNGCMNIVRTSALVSSGEKKVF